METSEPSPPSERAQPRASWYTNPEGNGQRYWDGSQWTDDYADNKGNVLHVPPPPSGGGSDESSSLEAWGWITAILFPIIGGIIGIVLLVRGNNRGVGVMVVALIAAVVWAGVLAGSGSSY